MAYSFFLQLLVPLHSLDKTFTYFFSPPVTYYLNTSKRPAILKAEGKCFVILTSSMHLSSNYNQSNCENNSTFYINITKIVIDRRLKSPKEDDLILHKPGLAKLIYQMILVISLLLMVSVLFNNISSQQCGIDTYSVYQMMLKGHTFKTFRAQPLSLDCRDACISDVRCQSYNYVMFKDICELNNRTKEARPEDFVKDRDRYYVTRAPKRGKKL